MGRIGLIERSTTWLGWGVTGPNDFFPAGGADDLVVLQRWIVFSGLSLIIVISARGGAADAPAGPSRYYRIYHYRDGRSAARWVKRDTPALFSDLGIALLLFIIGRFKSPDS